MSWFLNIKIQTARFIYSPFRAVKQLLNILRYVNIWSTFYWNLRIFPLKVAIHVPIYFGYKIDIRNFKRGNIRLKNSKIRRGQILIGISKYPTFPTKGESTLLRFTPGAQLILGERVTIARGCSMVVSYGGKIIFGNDVYLNQGVMLYSNDSISIGNHTRIGWKCQIYDSSVHLMVDIDSNMVRDPKKPIVISDNAWVANHVTITGGAYVPPFAIVAAHSLVNKSFQGEIGGFLFGMPAKYKPMKKVRILNESVEWEIKNNLFRKQDKKEINIKELGLDPLPLDANSNNLYVP